MAAKRVAKDNVSVKTTAEDVKKINIPSTIVTDLLGLEDTLFPHIKRHLAVIALAVTILAQIRVSDLKIKPVEFQQAESTNFYIKKVLAKSPSVLYVASAIAIKRTMAEYGTDTGPDRIISDFYELTTNISGPASAKGTLAAALSSSEKLRKFRRGKMLEWVGQIQAAPTYRPRKIYQELEFLTQGNFIAALPFKTDMVFQEVADEFMGQAGLDPTNPMEFADPFTIPNHRVPLEFNLGVDRISVKTRIADLELPTDSDALPTWQRLAIRQAIEIKGKKINGQ